MHMTLSVLYTFNSEAFKPRLQSSYPLFALTTGKTILEQSQVHLAQFYDCLGLTFGILKLFDRSDQRIVFWKHV